MKIVTNVEEFNELDDNNKFIGNFPKLENSKIIFNGKNNIIFCEENVILRNSVVEFNADNSLVYLSSDRYSYLLNLNINNNSVCYFGKNNYFNGNLHLILSEEKNIIIGDDNLFSFNIWFRTADPHLIYDINSKERINLSRNVSVGDHVWFGQNALVLKGANVGSGSIIAANTVVTNKNYSSNCIYGGNPSNLLKREIFWSGECVHKWTSEETNKKIKYDTEEYIYNYEEENLFLKLLPELESMNTAQEKLTYLEQVMSVKNKNRFFNK